MDGSKGSDKKKNVNDEGRVSKVEFLLDAVGQAKDKSSAMRLLKDLQEAVTDDVSAVMERTRKQIELLEQIQVCAEKLIEVEKAALGDAIASSSAPERSEDGNEEGP